MPTLPCTLLASNDSTIDFLISKHHDLESVLVLLGWMSEFKVGKMEEGSKETVEWEYARELNETGLVHYDQGKYDEAEKMFEESLAIYKKMLGDEHPVVADSLNNLASLYENQGKYDEAEKMYKESLRCVKRC